MAKIKEATVKIPKAPEQKVIKSLRKQQLILNQEYRHLDKKSWKSSTRNFFWKMSQNLQKTTYGGVSVLKKDFIAVIFLWNLWHLSENLWIAAFDIKGKA